MAMAEGFSSTFGSELGLASLFGAAFDLLGAIS